MCATDAIAWPYYCSVWHTLLPLSLLDRRGRAPAWRIVRHLDEWDSRMPLRRESRDFRIARFAQFLEWAGHITGIEDVARDRTLDLIPTLATFESGRRVRASSSPVDPGRL